MPFLRASEPAASAPIEELVEPNPDISRRDLLHGVGGRELVPQTDVEYRFIEEDRSGINTNFEIEDPSGRRWDAKFGTEVKPEVAASRLHWAIGFHQPPIYYVREWKIANGPHAGVQREARFRYEQPDWKNEGDWAWKDNPFSDTREMRGLIVLNILINNWDLKTSNNKRYQRKSAEPRHIYVVKDLGQSLGRTARILLGSGNSVRDFVEEDFIQEVDGEAVKFHFKPNPLSWGVARGITAEDVLWTCRRLAKLSDRQLQDAFRSAGYGEEESVAYAARIRRKVAEGLALEQRAGS